MICPIEGHECDCDEEGPGICQPRKAPPPPDMAEIERLAMYFGQGCFYHCKIGGDISLISTQSPSFTALMAAIRRYGEK